MATRTRSKGAKGGWRAFLTLLEGHGAPLGSREAAEALGVSQSHACIILERMRLYGTASVAGRGPHGGRLYTLTKYGRGLAKRKEKG